MAEATRMRQLIFKCLLALLRKHLIMSLLFCFRIEHGPWPVRLAVILQLQRVTTDEYLCGSHKAAERLLVVLHHIQVHGIRGITCHHEQYRNRMLIAARRFQIIGQILKDQALIKCPEGCRQLAEIVRRSDDQSIRLSYCIQYRRKPILADTMPFEPFLLTSKAGVPLSEANHFSII